MPFNLLSHNPGFFLVFPRTIAEHNMLELWCLFGFQTKWLMSDIPTPRENGFYSDRSIFFTKCITLHQTKQAKELSSPLQLTSMQDFSMLSQSCIWLKMEGNIMMEGFQSYCIDTKAPCRIIGTMLERACRKVASLSQSKTIPTKPTVVGYPPLRTIEFRVYVFYYFMGQFFPITWTSRTNIYFYGIVSM